MSEENKAIYRRFVEEVINQGDEAALNEIVAEDCVDHDPLPTQGPGREGYKQAVALLRHAIPDYSYTIDDIVAGEDRVMGRWTLSGTHSGPLFRMPPSGKQISTRGLEIVRIANGKIVEKWANRDLLGLIQQIAPAPAPQQAPR